MKITAYDEESAVIRSGVTTTIGAGLVEIHVSDPTDAHDASAISYDPTYSGLLATDVQAAIDELAGGAGPGGGGDTSGLIGAGFDGGLSVLVAGKAQDVPAPYTGTITGWMVKAQQDGDANFGIAKITNPATDASTSIVGTTAPSVSSARYATGSDMTGWTTAITAGDILRFTLSSVSTIRQVIVQLDYSRP